MFNRNMQLVLIAAAAVFGTDCFGLTEMQERMLDSIRSGDITDDFKGIFARSGVSSNELSMAIVGLEDYERNVVSNSDPFIREVIVKRLAEMGTTNALGSLRWVFANKEDDIEKLAAFRGVVRLSGLSTNELNGFSAWMTSTNKFERYRRKNVYRIVPAVLVEFARPETEKRQAFECFLNFTEEETEYVKVLDEALVALAPAYANSKRRLANLRAVLPRVRLTVQRRYITAAINELVAYPEANLPD